MTALEVFTQNDGEVTKAYYAEMNAKGSAGQIAVALFRCAKRSTRAKQYRGGRYRRAGYSAATIGARGTRRDRPRSDEPLQGAEDLDACKGVSRWRIQGQSIRRKELVAR